MPYTFNGSYPSEPENTQGWIYVSNPPPVPEGKELVWLNWEWVVRDPQPEPTENGPWSWNHDSKEWTNYISTANTLPFS
jgi:hypothetical protein